MIKNKLLQLSFLPIIATPLVFISCNDVQNNKNTKPNNPDEKLFSTYPDLSLPNILYPIEMPSEVKNSDLNFKLNIEFIYTKEINGKKQEHRSFYLSSNQMNKNSALVENKFNFEIDLSKIVDFSKIENPRVGKVLLIGFVSDLISEETVLIELKKN